ncbi:MAG TPA: putative zinc-binding protein [Denitromonas sp.]|nr:putative zinc-binding protein [Denitromonas sp.]
MSAKPIVYSCSECSSAAQLANHFALRLDREGRADMSCIAGIGGHVAPLVRLARSGRPLVALDGCVLACVRETLSQHDLVPTVHIRLDEFGVKKLKKADFDAAQARALYPRLLERLAAVVRPAAPG